MDHGHHNGSNKEDALRDADVWADSVIAAATERLDPTSQVQFLTEVIALLTKSRDSTDRFLHGDDPQSGHARPTPS